MCTSLNSMNITFETSFDFRSIGGGGGKGVSKGSERNCYSSDIPMRQMGCYSLDVPIPVGILSTAVAEHSTYFKSIRGGGKNVSEG
ncbi:hypothetical protein TNIN_490511 [Trichonephila inaurata madagascariensis]|uniref:Uncharacterized protein n=1 Tax=Trichonephila inaurata madagascariensis TaxID=2747483 RepID=A0A8X7BUH1_9ARAC|nr:hypothetical protein TNIN_490511 [Trichonephila inaurata madagascariensis]